MTFGAIGMKRPENFPKLFNIYRQASTTSARGRERQNAPTKIGARHCILSIAKPEEQERYNQMGTVVTHTIFHTGKPEAKQNDIFALCKEENGTETRFFRVQAVQDHGEMGIFTTYYCEERGDVNGLLNTPVEHSAADSQPD